MSEVCLLAKLFIKQLAIHLTAPVDLLAYPEFILLMFIQTSYCITSLYGY